MALLTYRKPTLSSPNDTYLGYTPPPIIQQDDLTVAPEQAATPQIYSEPDVTPQQQPTMTAPATVDDIWNMGAPDAQGIDPAVAVNLQRDPGQRSASIMLANAARRPLMDAAAPPVAIDAKPEQPIVDPTAGSVGEVLPTSGTGDVRARQVLSDDQGRPIPNKTIKDPLERYTEYQQRLNDWEPPRAHGWKRYVGPILQGWASGQRGSRSPWSGLGGAITGAITGQVAPKLTNEQWKASQQKETQDAIDQHIEQQKNIATIAHTQAETDKLKNPTPVVRPKRIVKDKNGIYRPIDAITGLGDDGKPVQGEIVKTATGGFKGWTHDSNGVAHYYENGTDTGRLDPGRNKVKLEDGRLVDPSQSYTAELTSGREGLADARTNEANKQENARTQSNIASVQAEQRKVEDALKNTAPMITKTRANPVSGLEEKYQDRNPIYVDLENRRDHLIDNARMLNSQLKPVVTPRPPSVTPGFATPKPPGGFTIDGAIAAWKMKPENHGKEPTKEQIADWQKKVDAKNKQ